MEYLFFRARCIQRNGLTNTWGNNQVQVVILLRISPAPAIPRGEGLEIHLGKTSLYDGHNPTCPGNGLRSHFPHIIPGTARE